jgi:hypothetical protein
VHVPLAMLAPLLPARQRRSRATAEPRSPALAWLVDVGKCRVVLPTGSLAAPGPLGVVLEWPAGVKWASGTHGPPPVLNLVVSLGCVGRALCVRLGLRRLLMLPRTHRSARSPISVSHSGALSVQPGEQVLALSPRVTVIAKGEMECIQVRLPPTDFRALLGSAGGSGPDN